VLEEICIDVLVIVSTPGAAGIFGASVSIVPLQSDVAPAHGLPDVAPKLFTETI
jgi:hypothetical protein